MTCPKCQSQMRQYERGGIVVDQCGECRGIFLDRGELDHLITAEAQWSGQVATPGRPPPPPVAPRYDDDRRYEQRSYDDDHRYEQRPYDDKHRRKKKKRESFFENLFDD
jgi:Zn-finger nucleic acid-binding protein